MIGAWPGLLDRWPAWRVERERRNRQAMDALLRLIPAGEESKVAAEIGRRDKVLGDGLAAIESVVDDLKAGRWPS